MINKWNFRTPTDEELHKRDRLAADLGISPVISLLLVQRGITLAEEAKRFFKPSLSDLHDPFLMPDMEKAVNRLNQALGDKEKILVYGDYDVDGLRPTRWKNNLFINVSMAGRLRMTPQGS